MASRVVGVIEVRTMWIEVDLDGVEADEANVLTVENPEGQDLIVRDILAIIDGEDDADSEVTVTVGDGSAGFDIGPDADVVQAGQVEVLWPAAGDLVISVTGNSGESEVTLKLYVEYFGNVKTSGEAPGRARG